MQAITHSQYSNKDALVIVEVIITKAHVLWKRFFEIELVWQKSQTPFCWFIPNFINNILQGINVLSDFLKHKINHTHTKYDNIQNVLISQKYYTYYIIKYYE